MYIHINNNIENSSRKMLSQWNARTLYISDGNYKYDSGISILSQRITKYVNKLIEAVQTNYYKLIEAVLQMKSCVLCKVCNMY